MSSCGRVCGHYIFLVTGGKYYRFLNMDGEVIQLGQSIRVTLTSHEVAQLAEISDLIHFMFYSALRTRWSQILHFPEEIVSEDHLLILVDRKHIYKPGFNIIHFVKMCHYLLIDQYRVFAILNISCSKCKKLGRKCRNTHYNEDGHYNDYGLIPVLYFAHYVAKWEWLYRRLVKYMSLNWPYHVFKKVIRNMLRSRDRWLDDKHFFKGEWRRLQCRCKLCESEPPDSDGDGWT